MVISNKPTSLVQTNVEPEATTPLLSNKMFGNTSANVPTKNAMREAIVKKNFLLIFV